MAFYRARYVYWLDKMGAGSYSALSGNAVGGASTGLRSPCPRYLAALWQRKAHAARLAFARWHFEQYAWRSWLPPVWKRLIACETFSNFRWDSGSYVSAFGIYRDGYRDDAHRIGQLSWDETLRKLKRYPTPREQYQAATSHYRTHGGFSGWGCRP